MADGDGLEQNVDGLEPLLDKAAEDAINALPDGDKTKELLKTLNTSYTQKTQKIAEQMKGLKTVAGQLEQAGPIMEAIVGNPALAKVVAKAVRGEAITAADFGIKEPEVVDPEADPEATKAAKKNREMFQNLFKETFGMDVDAVKGKLTGLESQTATLNMKEQIVGMNKNYPGWVDYKPAVMAELTRDPGLTVERAFKLVVDPSYYETQALEKIKKATPAAPNPEKPMTGTSSAPAATKALSVTDAFNAAMKSLGLAD